MAKWDERILEFIFEHGSGTPSYIAKHENIHVSKQYVSARLNELAEHGLVDSLGNGVYTLTEEGKLYLGGAYDAEKGKKEDVVDRDDFDILMDTYEELGRIMDYSA